MSVSPDEKKNPCENPHQSIFKVKMWKRLLCSRDRIFFLQRCGTRGTPGVATKTAQSILRIFKSLEKPVGKGEGGNERAIAHRSWIYKYFGATAIEKLMQTQNRASSICVRAVKLFRSGFSIITSVVNPERRCGGKINTQGTYP